MTNYRKYVILANVFEKIGSHVNAHPIRIIIVWAVICVVAFMAALTGLGGPSLFERLHSGEPEIAGAQATVGREILADLQAKQEDQTGEAITLAVLGVNAQDVASEILALAEKLGSQEQIDIIAHPLLQGLDDELSSASGAGDGFIIVTNLKADLGDSQARIGLDLTTSAYRDFAAALIAEHAKAKTFYGSDTLIVDAITEQLSKDLKTGELIALPIALIIMVFVFGGFLAAAKPLVGALASIGTAFGVLWLFSLNNTLEASVVNVISILGLGLSIDYALLIVSRFKEELKLATQTLRPGLAVREALIRCLQTAGKTVLFSALIVAISISALLFFDSAILWSIGLGALLVVLLALATALTLVPALLRLSGAKLLAPSPLQRIGFFNRVLAKTSDVSSDQGVFYHLTARVQAHPVRYLVAAFILLAIFAAPLAGMQLRNSGIELLPKDNPQRHFSEQLAQNFPQTTPAQITVLTKSDDDATATMLAELQEVAHLSQIQAPVPMGDGYQLFGLRLQSDDAASPEALQVVKDIRNLPSAKANPTYVLGQAASQVDFNEDLSSHAALAALIVILATFVLLFLMTGSLLIPLKALLTNLLSICAALGITVWVFQENHLSGVLNFTSTGGVETFVAVLVVAFAFGLAMDYEMFLLSRVKEFYDQGDSNDEALRKGIQRSGRIITSAALIIVCVFSGFIAGEIIIIKQVGLALAVAVFLDATVVRLILVPATMTLLGRWNWWAPAPLRRLHEKLNLSH